MRIALLAAAFPLALLGSTATWAQSFRHLGTEFNAVRSVTISPGKKPTIVVTQFFHHGEVREDGRNVAVLTRNPPRPVPTRVLQTGPGDFCRVAFQTIEGQNAYDVFYGGEPPKEPLPPWTATQGLLLETRQFKNCNLNSYHAVREAFQSAKPIGADYVDGVHHAENPFTLKRGPFLSRYSGTLHIASAGTYGFMTSSQDCSFLVIDDKVVVDAPGMHPPRHQALPGSRKDIVLSAGPHKFEYYHAAAGPEAMMVAAWEVNPRDPKPQPTAIPPEAFATSAVAREPAGPVATRTEKVAPDFLVHIAGSVPLPDNEIPLVGVQFLDASPKALTSTAKFLWEFGDGQRSEQPNPDHVYLRPGLYTVKLTIRRGTKPFEITNRVYVDEPRVSDPSKFHQLDDYLRVLETYNPRTLDAVSVRQLVLAFQAKADMLMAPPESAESASPPAAEPKTPAVKRAKESADPKKSQAIQRIASAVNAGKVVFLEESAAKGDEDLIQLARLIGPMARDQLGDSALAATIWQGAARRIANPELRAECLVQCADIAVNDLANAQAAKPLLEAATKVLGGDRSGPIAHRFFRVWGDYYALSGDGKSARKAYQEAEAIVSMRKTFAERTAWQGAHGRSTEQFLKTGEYDRAIAQIRRWQDEFPSDKIHGYVTLLHARYWAGRQKYEQAIALAGQLSAVNPDSPYIDQLQTLAAECHLAAGAPDKALATWEALLKNYPGSPLVPEVKKRIAELKAEGASTKKPKRPARPSQK